MASPTIVGTSGDDLDGNATSSVITLPDGSDVVGRLVIVLHALDGVTLPAWLSGWTSLWEVATGGLSGSARYRIIDGTEGFDGTGDTITLTHPSEGSAWQCFLIDDHGSSAFPPTVGVTATGTGAGPDPPLCNPATAKDFLWLAVSAYDGNVSLSAAPADFTDLLQHRWANAEGVGIGSARRLLTAASLNPAAFTKSASGRSITNTIAIHPALTALEKVRARVQVSSAEAATVRDLSTRRGKGAFVNPHTRASVRAAILADPTVNEAEFREGCLDDLNDLIILPPPQPVRQNYTLCGVAGKYIPFAALVETLASPVANFSFSVTLLDVTFTDASTTPNGTIDEWDWDWGDESAHGTTENPEHTYAEAGQYAVTLTVTDSRGLTDPQSRTVTVVAAGNQPPIADFTVAIDDLQITCTDASTDPNEVIAGRAWTFGDSNSSTDTNPVHTYAAAGTYTVRLVVTDNGGLTDDFERPVTVTAPPAGVVIPSSIDATGATDVTNISGTGPLQTWLAGLPDNTTILGPPGARYRVEFGIMLQDRRGLSFNAVDPLDPPELFQTELYPYGFNPDGSSNKENRNRQVLGFRFGGGHSLRNWWLRGAQPNYRPFIAELEDQNALLLGGVDGFIAEDCFLTEIAGDFVFLNDTRRDGPGTEVRNQNIILRRLTGRKAGRQGVSPVGCTNTVIEHCDFEEINRTCIDIEPPGSFQHIVNLHVHHNRFATFGNNFFAGHGDAGATVDNITIEDNDGYGRPLVGNIRGWRTTSEAKPGDQRRSNIFVRRNHAHDIPSIANGNITVMEFSACDTVECVDNTVDAPGGTVRIRTGVFFNECCDITYSGNDWGNPVHDHEVTVDYNVVTVNVAAAGALAGETTVPLDPALNGNIPNNTRITFNSGRILLTTGGTHLAGAATLTTKALPENLVDADVGEYRTPITELDGVTLEWSECA